MKRIATTLVIALAACATQDVTSTSSQKMICQTCEPDDDSAAVGQAVTNTVTADYPEASMTPVHCIRSSEGYNICAMSIDFGGLTVVVICDDEEPGEIRCVVHTT